MISTTFQNMTQLSHLFTHDFTNKYLAAKVMFANGIYFCKTMQRDTVSIKIKETLDFVL